MTADHLLTGYENALRRATALRVFYRRQLAWERPGSTRHADLLRYIGLTERAQRLIERAYLQSLTEDQLRDRQARLTSRGQTNARLNQALAERVSSPLNPTPHGTQGNRLA